MRRNDALNPEIQPLLTMLRKHAASGLTAEEIEQIAQRLDREVRSMAERECNLPHADRADVTQRVLFELFANGSSSPALDDLARADGDDLKLLYHVRGRIRRRLQSRTIDRIRRRNRRREVALLHAAGSCVEETPPALPDLKSVLAVLTNSPRMQEADPFDRLLVTHMASHCASITATARAHGVNHGRVSRAVKRMSPLLHAEFELA